MERHHTPTAAVFAYEELNTLAALIAKAGKNRTSQFGESELFGSSATECHQLEAEAEPALNVATNKTVKLECHRKTMCCRTRQAALLSERSQIEWAPPESRKNNGALVDHADTA